MSLDLETVHSDMLAAISKDYQKTPGFPAWDFTRAFALGILSLDGDIEPAEARLDVFSLTGEALDAFVEQHRGITRRAAVHAVATLRVISGSEAEIEAGDLFATASGVEFLAMENAIVSAGSTFQVQAAEGGVSGNVAAGTITVIPAAIANLGSFTNDAAAAGGVDEEDDDAFRGRFFEALRYPGNGGNAHQYRQWAMSVEGVGRAVVIPTPTGANTVDVVLTASSGAPASASLVAEVQALIDPNANGDGSGEAPIGAVCTVSAATEKTLAFAMTLTLEEEAAQSAVTAAVEDALDALCKKTALAGTSLRYSDVADTILVEGVADYSALTVNGASGAVTFGVREIPVKGTVTITYAGG